MSIKLRTSEECEQIRTATEKVEHCLIFSHEIFYVTIVLCLNIQLVDDDDGLVGWLLAQGKITAQGKLLLQDTLLVVEQSAKAPRVDKQVMKERRVFLFEQIVIFSEEIDKRRNNMSSPGYIYKNSIKVELCIISYHIRNL